MRYCKYLIVFFIVLIPFTIIAQTDNIDITGLWKGNLYNDSTKQFYKYEIGIGEEKGKLWGFSHTWYNDKNYFVVKKVKVKRTDGKIIIEDVEIIAYNYPESPPKGVRRIHILTLENKDSILTLSGAFSTNRTKIYAPATGTVMLERKNEYRKQSDLMPHLQELGLEDKLSFVAKDKELARLEEEKTLNKADNKAVIIPAAATAINAPTVKASTKKRTSIEPIANIKTAPLATVNFAPAAEVLLRKNILQETMYFRSDSLELVLYDNGEVDGDTVSVLMNGEIIMAKQRLSTNAIRKTIYIPANADSVELVMYAENLGTLPPNSGLLVVHDGKDIYEIRFSGDLQKNAAILLKRRRK